MNLSLHDYYKCFIQIGDGYISVLYVKLSNKEERNIIDIVIYHLLQHVRVVPIS